MKNNFLSENIENYKKDLAKLISFKTVLKDEYPNNEMKKALSFMKELADRDGIKSYINPDGYYGYMEIGEGDELIGILAHIDVVPEGDIDKWDSHPFELREENGNLYGRGTTDDKGPLMLSYYLLKYLKDFKLNRRIRLIFPTDEESSWRGVAKYKELEEIPSFGITPDSCFPVTFLETEAVQMEFHSIPQEIDWEIHGGVAANVVPSQAEFIKNGEKIEAKGISAHAMVPQNGDNAIYKLLKKLPENIEHPLIDFIKNEVNYEINGETLFGKLIEDKYAKITFNLAIIDIDQNQQRIVIDSRVPITSSVSEIQEILKEKIKKYGLSLKERKRHSKVYIPEEHWIIKDLVKAYSDVIGEHIDPQASMGGTYAKSMKNTVAFGPLMPWAEQTQHEYNEYININEYIKAFDIYVNVFKKWTQAK